MQKLFRGIVIAAVCLMMLGSFKVVQKPFGSGSIFYSDCCDDDYELTTT